MLGKQHGGGMGKSAFTMPKKTKSTGRLASVLFLFQLTRRKNTLFDRIERARYFVPPGVSTNSGSADEREFSSGNVSAPWNVKTAEYFDSLVVLRLAACNVLQ